ncbi:hypothetical protein M427DRAFT_50774 [Gonapodya prolifera JEL478]|uniref:Uncharacterized protein n=1 Tax=Gonapodya prolifera (strain JEL478) TaxID=1344416 RepID=A0A139B0F3_GONPJ|nr:hypothetical protein M427DRAFT_50774 [Gonapodya prolifera JEL478]|eukprot:KXS22454.1 hypothetical protein M427DRAFT_50774 [Gonapodya prolifera JEL478]
MTRAASPARNRDARDASSELARLPLSHDLLAYYRQRIDRADQDYADALSRIDECALHNDESHALRWECSRRATEIRDLQVQLSDAQTALFDERRQTLRVMAENDELKIQELRDRRKIRYLLSITSSVETGETTYLRPRLPKHLTRAGMRDMATSTPRTPRPVKPKPVATSPSSRRPVFGRQGARSPARHVPPYRGPRPASSASPFPRPPSATPSDSPTLVADSASPSPTSPSDPDSPDAVLRPTLTGPDGPEGPDDVFIPGDEIEALKLTVVALRAQLEEERNLTTTTLAGLHSDRLSLLSEHALHVSNLTTSVGILTDRVHKLRTVARDATRELLETKRAARVAERKWKEEKAAMVEEVGRVRGEREGERRRSEEAERAADTKYSQMHATLISDLRAHVAHLETTLAQTTSTLSTVQGQHAKTVDALKQRTAVLRNSYESLRRRREYEIEGFRSDIVMLRGKVRELERYIARWAGLEGKEAELLEMARETGRHADKISTELHGLKAKMYDLEDEMRSLKV